MYGSVAIVLDLHAKDFEFDSLTLEYDTETYKKKSF